MPEKNYIHPGGVHGDGGGQKKRSGVNLKPKANGETWILPVSKCEHQCWKTCPVHALPSVTLQVTPNQNRLSIHKCMQTMTECQLPHNPFYGWRRLVSLLSTCVLYKPMVWTSTSETSYTITQVHMKVWISGPHNLDIKDALNRGGVTCPKPIEIRPAGV